MIIVHSQLLNVFERYALSFAKNVHIHVYTHDNYGSLGYLQCRIVYVADNAVVTFFAFQDVG